jgi:nucleoside-diphosphate-sugar epimerase
MSLENLNSQIAIVGGTGFIGQHLINYLIEKKVFTVRALTRNQNFSNFDKSIKIIEGSLSSRTALDKLTKDQNIVINLGYINNDYKSNIKAIEQLVDSAINSGVSKLIHFSTAIVAGRVNNKIITEDTECRPFNEYEKTKLAIEKRILELAHKKIEVIIIRPTAVFGLGGINLLKTIKSILNQSRILSTAQLMLNKFRSMHLVPVEYVVSATHFLITTPKDLSGEIFILSMDDQKNNNFFYVINRIAIISNAKKYSERFFPFSSLFLEIVLRTFGRSKIKPYQLYSNEKIKKYGYLSESNFESSLDEFIEYTIK